MCARALRDIRMYIYKRLAPVEVQRERPSRALQHASDPQCAVSESRVRESQDGGGEKKKKGGKKVRATRCTYVKPFKAVV